MFVFRTFVDVCVFMFMLMFMSRCMNMNVNMNMNMNLDMNMNTYPNRTQSWTRTWTKTPGVDCRKLQLILDFSLVRYFLINTIVRYFVLVQYHRNIDYCNFSRKYPPLAMSIYFFTFKYLTTGFWDHFLSCISLLLQIMKKVESPLL